MKVSKFEVGDVVEFEFPEETRNVYRGSAMITHINVERREITFDALPENLEAGCVIRRACDF